MNAPMSGAVLITGGAKRLGAAIARAVAAAGFPVVIHAHTAADDAHVLAEELGGHVVLADLAAPDAAPRLIASAVAKAGPLFGLINNASRFVFDRPANVTAASISEHMAPNLIAPVLLTQHFAAQPGLEAGVVINMLDHKLQNLNPDFFAYTLSKAALAAATEMMAMAYAPRLRVCGIAPGLTMKAPKQSEEKFAAAWRANPLERGPTPEDIAAAAVFLLRSPAITGSVITVDSGEHLMHRGRDVAFLAP
jgi:NAD(P)-dependent dehydrogenase (short-subunit alcohol dehydrogenase family)